MKETLCYELYDIINDKKAINLFIENKETGEKQKYDDIIICFKYKSNISYLSLSKSNTIKCYDDEGKLVDLKLERILELEIEDNDIEEIEISNSRVMINTKLFLVAFTKKI